MSRPWIWVQIGFMVLVLCGMGYCLWLNHEAKRAYNAASRYRLVTEQRFGGGWQARIEEKYSPWDWELHYKDASGWFEGETESDAGAQAQAWLAEQCAKERFKAEKHVHDVGCAG